jgi:hypothetical protein
MSSYVLVDCCPVPAKLEQVVRACLHESGATLQSCYRADDVSALLARCGKHSQTWLFEHQGTPAQPNPANPPGRSTHELRNDGVAYPGPAGMRLPYWCVGMDLDDAHVQAFIRAAAKHGWIATITYPGSRSEFHHVNLRREPKFALPPLKRGAKASPMVWALKKDLRKLGYLKGKDPASGFHGWLYEAVVAFQRDHHLTPDGVVGPHTQAAIKAALRQKAKAR